MGLAWLIYVGLAACLASNIVNPPLIDDNELVTALLGLSTMKNNTKWPKGEEREMNFEHMRQVGVLPDINIELQKLGSSEFDKDGNAVGFELRRQHVQWIVRSVS